MTGQDMMNNSWPQVKEDLAHEALKKLDHDIEEADREYSGKLGALATLEWELIKLKHFLTKKGFEARTGRKI